MDAFTFVPITGNTPGFLWSRSFQQAMDRENPSRYSEIAINFVLRCACSFEQTSSAPEQCVANTGKHAGMERVKVARKEIKNWALKSQTKTNTNVARVIVDTCVM